MKRFFCFLLTVLLLLSSLTFPAFADSEIKVLLNGTALTFDVPPQIIGDRTMVPMRKIFEELGATVQWDGATRTITANREDITITMQIDNREITVGNVVITLDVPPLIVDDRTLVPARAVAESLKANVDWDAATRTVLITDPRTAFLCSAEPVINYGLADMWNKTRGTGYDPIHTTLDKVYVGQTFLIAPLYSGFAADEEGNVHITCSISYRTPDGTEKFLSKEIEAIKGKDPLNMGAQSNFILEHTTKKTDPLGIYTFTIQSRDDISGKTATCSFSYELVNYTYEKNEFKSLSELQDFLYNYSRYPNPDRIIDAVIYIEKNNYMSYPILYSSLVEILAKNPFVYSVLKDKLEAEFGQTKSNTLKLLEDAVTAYIRAIESQETSSLSYVQVPERIQGKIDMYGTCTGIYLTSGSYEAAKRLAETSHDGITFSQSERDEYMLYTIEELIEGDPLFKAYCMYMAYADLTVSQPMKDTLLAIFE